MDEPAMDAMCTQRACSVLVVEDEELVCEMISEALVECGFDVVAVTTAGEALCYLTTGSVVDVLFTDIDLPGGMDGGRLAVLARELRPGLPVVYASGGVTVNQPLRAVPGSAFLPKPYNPTQVCSLIENLVAAH